MADDRAALVAGALRLAGAGDQVADLLGLAGIAVLVLKGPHLQRRLFGTWAAYASADVDLLVRRPDQRRARQLLAEAGWSFLPENGMLWWLDQAAAFERDGLTVDLHWGIHGSLLRPRHFAPLEDALWANAQRLPGGLFEPAIEPLVVYLALHAAGHEFSAEKWDRGIAAASELVSDWTAVEQLAARCRITPTVAHALGRARGELDLAAAQPAIGDSGRLQAELAVSRMLRGHTPATSRVRTWARSLLGRH